MKGQRNKAIATVPGSHRIGRKEAIHVRILASQYTEIAIRTLAEIMQDKGEKSIARILAANALLDRGWGKPTQPLENVVDKMSDEELRERVNNIMLDNKQTPLFPEVIDAKLDGSSD